MIGGLTRRQQQALKFIKQYCNKTGRGPTHQEIADAIGLKSKSGVNRIVVALEEIGEIMRHRHFRHKRRARGIVIVQRFCKNCGAPIP